MSDQDRAQAAWTGVVEMIDQSSDSQIEALLEAEFAAVRLEERRAIVAWLRRRASAAGMSPARRTALHEAAGWIERGEHEARRVLGERSEVGA